jgi:hypothetical protein
MIDIRKIECDYVNQFTIATVEVFETTMGVQRLKDTFNITLKGIYDITDPALQDMIYAKFAEIGYEIIPGIDPTVQAETPGT